MPIAKKSTPAKGAAAKAKPVEPSSPVKTKPAAPPSIRTSLSTVDDEIMLSEQEAAEAAGYRAQTFKRWRLSGKGGPPAVYLPNGRVRYPAGKYRAWKESLPTQPPTQSIPAK